ncbi:MAG: hypothetical protein H7844_15205 [Nitrospirae bacterium YQR-1]
MGGYTEKKKNGIMKFVILAVLSCVLYVVLLVKQMTLIGYFSKGGFYALLPVATAFLFSFVHGGFTGEFWTVIGIEAKRIRR